MGLINPFGPGFTRFESNAPATPNTSTAGTSVSNPAGGANTKNTTWTELIASSAFDTTLVVVTVTSSTSTGVDTSTLLDIGIGAAAAETVIIPDLLVGFVPAYNGAPCSRSYIFPLRIPAGSRISARSQSVRTTGSTSVLIELFGGPSNLGSAWVGQKVVAYGINTADSGGVSVTAGNSGAETATPVAIGTTSQAHKALVLGFQGNNAAYTALSYHFDLGIDTASTSWLVRDYFYLQTGTNEAIANSGKPWLPIYAEVPSGTVLVVGGECSGTGEPIDFAVYGVS